MDHVMTSFVVTKLPPCGEKTPPCGQKVTAMWSKRITRLPAIRVRGRGVGRGGRGGGRNNFILMHRWCLELGPLYLLSFSLSLSSSLPFHFIFLLLLSNRHLYNRLLNLLQIRIQTLITTSQNLLSNNN